MDHLIATKTQYYSDVTKTPNLLKAPLSDNNAYSFWYLKAIEESTATVISDIVTDNRADEFLEIEPPILFNSVKRELSEKTIEIS